MFEPSPYDDNDLDYDDDVGDDDYDDLDNGLDFDDNDDLDDQEWQHETYLLPIPDELSVIKSTNLL